MFTGKGYPHLLVNLTSQRSTKRPDELDHFVGHRYLVGYLLQDPAHVSRQRPHVFVTKNSSPTDKPRPKGGLGLGLFPI